MAILKEKSYWNFDCDSKFFEPKGCFNFNTCFDNHGSLKGNIILCTDASELTNVAN